MGRKSDVPRVKSFHERIDAALACGAATVRTIRCGSTCLLTQWTKNWACAYALAAQRWEAVMPCKFASALITALGVYLLCFGMSLFTILLVLEAMRFSGVCIKVNDFCVVDASKAIETPKTEAVHAAFSESEASEEEKDDEDKAEEEDSPVKEAPAPKEEAVEKSVTLCERVHAACHQKDSSAVIAMASDLFIAAAFTIAAVKINTVSAILTGLRAANAIWMATDGLRCEQLNAVLRKAVGNAVPLCFVYPRVLLTAFLVTLGVVLPHLVHALFTAVIGADLAIGHGCEVLRALKLGYVSKQLSSGFVVVALAGAFFQLRHESVPLLLRIIVALPLLVERLLRWAIASVN